MFVESVASAAAHGVDVIDLPLLDLHTLGLNGHANERAFANAIRICDAKSLHLGVGHGSRNPDRVSPSAKQRSLREAPERTACAAARLRSPGPRTPTARPKQQMAQAH